MPLPNTSPAMSPTPATRIDVLRMSMPISRKWRSTFVQPPRDGDAHRLVVVAGGAARCERVVEPELVALRDAVRGVGQVRGALVGGDNEVRIVLVVAEDAGRRHDLVPT